MEKGKVKWFNSDKGYGFIEPEAAGTPDVFFHYKVLNALGLKEIQDGQKVCYETEVDEIKKKISVKTLKII